MTDLDPFCINKGSLEKQIFLSNMYVCVHINLLYILYRVYIKWEFIRVDYRLFRIVPQLLSWDSKANSLIVIHYVRLDFSVGFQVCTGTLNTSKGILQKQDEQTSKAEGSRQEGSKQKLPSISFYVGCHQKIAAEI